MTNKDSIPVEISRVETSAVANQIPVKRFETYLSGFHFYSGRRAEQREVHRYCTAVHEDLRQCVLFDGNGKEARLAGVEYIVSERLFKTLPDDEKKLWHSYRYEVKSGQLVAPDLSPKAEHDLMAELVSSYGKTWQTWQTESDSTLPFGGPALMMGFTRDGQLDPNLLQNRDNRLKIVTSEKQQMRSDILGRSPVTGADSWENGPAIQLPALTKRNEPQLQKDTLQ
ncbi:OBAP family protein [Larkinella rosea]|uniref:OBAP family protein n=1 Tax=Larkinella rosea TaxID=2025312 RepID=UPI001E4AD836|nr:OBAP family protein [Larkinella rosea]